MAAPHNMRSLRLTQPIVEPDSGHVARVGVSLDVNLVARRPHFYYRVLELRHLLRSRLYPIIYFFTASEGENVQQ